jgi:hypothetical protein
MRMTNMIYVENKNGYNQKNCTFHAFVGLISGHNSERQNAHSQYAMKH